MLGLVFALGGAMAFSFLLPIAAAGSFVFVTDAHGVKVEMAKDTKDIEVKAEGDFNAPPEKVIEAMTNYENAKSWQKSLSESRILDKEAHGLNVYQKLKMPVISDRDFTLPVTWGDEDHDPIHPVPRCR